VTKCKCIQDGQEHLAEVKKYLEEEIEEFWNNPIHWNHRSHAKAIGQLFGEYIIYARSIFTSKLSNYVYHIDDKGRKFCLPTIIHIYGLNQNAMTAARDLLFW